MHVVLVSLRTGVVEERKGESEASVPDVKDQP